MLSDELRNKFAQMMKENPQGAINELQKDPKLLEILLNSDNELNKTKQEINNERTKYVNMTSTMQQELKEKSAQLKISQGLLIGAGVLLLLKLLDEDCVSDLS